METLAYLHLAQAYESPANRLPATPGRDAACQRSASTIAAGTVGAGGHGAVGPGDRPGPGVAIRR